MSASFIERKLECLENGSWEAGVIRVFQPERVDPHWTSRYELSWPGMERGTDIHGVDGFQAMELAMRMVPSEIAMSRAFKESRLRMFGDEHALDMASLIQFFPIQQVGLGDEQ